MLEVEQAVAVAYTIEAHEHGATEQVGLISAGRVSGEVCVQGVGLPRL
jgi:hypothetical protein